MRVMVLVKASPESEAGVMPSTELLEAMGRFNEELVRAGVMVAGEGLHPSARGSACASRAPSAPSSTARSPRPGADRRLLAVAGAVDGRGGRVGAPLPEPDARGGELEIRPVFEAEDFGDEFTPELREQDERLRAEVAGGRRRARRPPTVRRRRSGADG
jgi:hypothetical protein